jgi:flagellar biosynthesis protein FlhB
MNLTQLISLGVHGLIIATAFVTLLFSTNIYVVGTFSVIMVAMMINAIILDRCTFCDPEETLPVLNTTPTKLINRVFGISNEVPIKDLEKIIMAFFAAGFLGKFAILLLFEAYKGTSYSEYCKSFPYKNGIHSYIYHYLN